MRVGTTHYRCPNCRRVLPADRAHFYVGRTGKQAGRLSGYCRPCTLAVNRAYEQTDRQRARRRVYRRDYYRRTHAVPPDRYLVGRPAESGSAAHEQEDR